MIWGMKRDKVRGVPGRMEVPGMEVVVGYRIMVNREDFRMDLRFSRQISGQDHSNIQVAELSG